MKHKSTDEQEKDIERDRQRERKTERERQISDAEAPEQRFSLALDHFGLLPLTSLSLL